MTLSSARMSTSTLTEFHITDAIAVLAETGLSYVDPGTVGTGYRVRSAKFSDVIVVPVVNGQEEAPPPVPWENDRRTEWGRIRTTAREALLAAGWEPRGETSTGVEFLAHTPVVRMARAVLSAAGIPLLPRGYPDGRGAHVHPTDGKHRHVRIVVHAGGHRHKPYEHRAEGAEEWRALMQQCLDVMNAAGWAAANMVLHAEAQFSAPDDVDVPERPAAVVLGCDPEADEFVQHVAKILRERGYRPLAAVRGQAEKVWGFSVLAPPLAADHVMVTWDHNQPGPATAVAPHNPEERRKFFHVLGAMERTLTRRGLTISTTERGRTVVWVQRPERSIRARIVLADDSGFAWLPELAPRYRHETRWTMDEPWAPQLDYPAESMLRTLESGLRKGRTTAESEDRVIYVTSTEQDDFAPFSRYVPLEGS